MREYIQTLDHCPFCHEKFILTHLKKYYRLICPLSHNLDTTNLGVWSYKKDPLGLNHSLCIRVVNNSSVKFYKKNWTMVAFDVLKKKDRTRIFDYKEDDKVIYGPTINLRFDKFISFDLDNEEKFKNKLNSIILFS